ncbi:MAG: hypothetical protein RM338_26875 [Nostoc sp. DedQUE12a]|nr:hypothetical protein [Nostoc sp. DedQUE12a]
MNKIAFYGTISSGDYKVVADILKNWLKTEDLDIKIRLSGEEIVYEDEQVYLYSYNSVTVEGVPPSFLLEGNMSRTLEEVKVLLQQLWQLCQEQNLTSSFEYVEVTEDGDEVTEQFYIE